jgi:hypothetical protein
MHLIFWGKFLSENVEGKSVMQVFLFMCFTWRMVVKRNIRVLEI